MEQEIEDFLDRESLTTEMHIPFHHYAGPGTHVLRRVMTNSRPINAIDAAALIHDIEYTGNVPQHIADLNMEKNVALYNAVLTPFILNAVFTIKDFFGYSPPRNPEIAQYMKTLAPDLLKDFPKMRFSTYQDAINFEDDEELLLSDKIVHINLDGQMPDSHF